MIGSHIVGYGKRCYPYVNEKTTEKCKVGFAPRSKSYAFYLANLPGRSELLAEMEKHQLIGGCLYITKLLDTNIN